MKDILTALVERRDLTTEQASKAMEAIACGT